MTCPHLGPSLTLPPPRPRPVLPPDALGVLHACCSCLSAVVSHLPLVPEECLAPGRHLRHLCRINEFEGSNAHLQSLNQVRGPSTHQAVRGGMGPTAMKPAPLTWALPQRFVPQGRGRTAGFPSHTEPVGLWRARAAPAAPSSLCPLPPQSLAQTQELNKMPND